MTVVLVPVVAKVGFDGVLIVTIAAGALLVVAAIARLGRFVRLLPWPLIEGFTLGIAAIILLQQVPNALGVAPPDSQNTALRALRSLAEIGSAQWQALAAATLVACLMLAIPRLHRSAPSSLIAVAVVTATAVALGWNLPAIGSIPNSIPLPSIPHLPSGELSGLLGAALSIAALAAIESLLSARVADGMSDTERHDPDRELLGQGIANIGSGLFGGMPATGAIARTAVNVRAGARTRLAAVVHAGVLLVVVVALAPLVAKIPLAALAGVLMVTAAHMVEFGTIGRILRSTRGDAAILVVTAAATIIFDLVVAVEVGLVVAAVIALHSVAKESGVDRDDLVSVEFDSVEEHELLRRHVVVYELDGSLFFGASQRFLLELADVSDVRWVVLRMRQVRMLDATGARAIGDLVERLEHRGITVLLASVRPEHRRLIEGVAALEELEEHHQIVESLDSALGVVRDEEAARAA